MYMLILRTDHSHASTQTLQPSLPSGLWRPAVSHIFNLRCEAFIGTAFSTTQPLYICLPFLSLSVSVSCFYTFSASCFHSLSLTHFYLSVFVCIGTALSPPYLSFHISSSLSPVWPSCHGNHLFRLSLNAFHKSVSMGNVTRMHSAQHQRGNNLM